MAFEVHIVDAPLPVVGDGRAREHETVDVLVLVVGPGTVAGAVSRCKCLCVGEPRRAIEKAIRQTIRDIGEREE